MTPSYASLQYRRPLYEHKTRGLDQKFKPLTLSQYLKVLDKILTKK